MLEVGDKTETKVICVPQGDHHQDHLTDLGDLPGNFVQELDPFFHAYRMLESTSVSVVAHRGRDEARPHPPRRETTGSRLEAS